MLSIPSRNNASNSYEKKTSECDIRVYRCNSFLSSFSKLSFFFLFYSSSSMSSCRLFHLTRLSLVRLSPSLLFTSTYWLLVSREFDKTNQESGFREKRKKESRSSGQRIKWETRFHQLLPGALVYKEGWTLNFRPNFSHTIPKLFSGDSIFPLFWFFKFKAVWRLYFSQKIQGVIE